MKLIATFPDKPPRYIVRWGFRDNRYTQKSYRSLEEAHEVAQKLYYTHGERLVEIWDTEETA